MIQKSFIPNKTALITLIAACLVVIISLGIRQTFGLFFFDFEIDLGCTQTQFGFAMGVQLLFWGLLGPIFGIVTDKYGGRIAVIIGFLFYLAGIYFLNYGPNTGSWFIFDIGILVGIGLGATAISIPVSIVAKHFPLNTRTMATGIVTAAGSFGYFISPMYTRYTLLEFGWNTTLVIFAIMIIFGLFIAFFISTPMQEFKKENENNQTVNQAIKEAFSNKSFNYLTLGFFVCGWHIALVATHIPMHIRDKGLEDWTATAILALIGLFNIFGTLSSGYLSTRISKKKTIKCNLFIKRCFVDLFCLYATKHNQFINFWYDFWLSLASHSSPNKWNSWSYIWNKIYNFALWICFFESSSWIISWCLSWRIIS